MTWFSSLSRKTASTVRSRNKRNLCFAFVCQFLFAFVYEFCFLGEDHNAKEANLQQHIESKPKDSRVTKIEQVSRHYFNSNMFHHVASRYNVDKTKTVNKTVRDKTSTI